MKCSPNLSRSSANEAHWGKMFARHAILWSLFKNLDKSGPKSGYLEAKLRAHYAAEPIHDRYRGEVYRWPTRAELSVVLVMKLADEDVSVSGNDTMDRESACAFVAPAVPCRALRA